MMAAVGAIEDTGHVEMSRTYTAKWIGILTERNHQARHRGDAKRSRFLLMYFPATGKTAADADAFLAGTRASPN